MNRDTVFADLDELFRLNHNDNSPDFYQYFHVIFERRKNIGVFVCFFKKLSSFSRPLRMRGVPVTFKHDSYTLNELFTSLQHMLVDVRLFKGREKCMFPFAIAFLFISDALCA